MTVHDVRIRPEAEQDVTESFEWYEERVPGLGSRFIAAVDDAIEHVRQHPTRYPITYRGIRQSLVKHFPSAFAIWLTKRKLKSSPSSMRVAAPRELHKRID